LAGPTTLGRHPDIPAQDLPADTTPAAKRTSHSPSQPTSPKKANPATEKPASASHAEPATEKPSPTTAKPATDEQASPTNAKPATEKPASASKPATREQSAPTTAKPATEQPSPSQAKPATEKPSPSQAKPATEKPSPSQAKPATEKPEQAKPATEKPSQAKPGGSNKGNNKKLVKAQSSKDVDLKSSLQAMDGLKGQWKTSYSDLSAIIEVVESESSDEYGWCQGTRVLQELQAVWSEMKAMMADKSTSEGDLLSLWLLKPQPKKALESKYSDRDASSVICACLAKHEPILKRAKALLSKFHRLHDVNCEE